MLPDRLAFVPDLALGLAYLVAWLAPGLAGAGVVGWMVTGIEFELLALLGAYLIAMSLIATLDPKGDWRARLAGPAITLGVVGFVVLEVVRHRFWWPAVALAALLGNRLMALLSGRLRTEDARIGLLYDALMALGAYVIAIAPTFYVPVPVLGALGPLPPEHARWCALPADFVADFFDRPVAAGWCAEPHRALAGGALYFLVSAVRGARHARRARRRSAGYSPIQ